MSIPTNKDTPSHANLNPHTRIEKDTDTYTNIDMILKTNALASINAHRNTNGENDNNDTMNADVPKNTNYHVHVENIISTDTTIHTTASIVAHTSIRNSMNTPTDNTTPIRVNDF